MHLRSIFGMGLKVNSKLKIKKLVFQFDPE